MMNKLVVTLLLMLMSPALPSVSALRRMKPLTAKQQGLKGTVRAVEHSCSTPDGKVHPQYYVYSRKGKELLGPVVLLPDCMVGPLASPRGVKRNDMGDVVEGSLYVEGELFSAERYEYEYDSTGNWVRRAAMIMRNYEMEGGDWKAGEWRNKEECRRRIEYYP